MRISLNPSYALPSSVQSSSPLPTRQPAAQPLDAFLQPRPQPVNLGSPSRPVVFTGFDDTKLNSPLKLQEDGQPKSAKYTFAKLAQAAGVTPQSKQEAEDWFNQYIRPGMEAAGFRVGWVKGDKALIATRENPQGEVVDFVRGAGSGDPSYTALAWQPEGGDAGGMDLSLMGDPLGMGDPFLKSQLDLSKRIQQRSKSNQEQVLRDLLDRIRLARIAV